MMRSPFRTWTMRSLKVKHVENVHTLLRHLLSGENSKSGGTQNWKLQARKLLLISKTKAKTIGEVRQLTWFLSYYRRYIKEFSKNA